VTDDEVKTITLKVPDGPMWAHRGPSDYLYDLTAFADLPLQGVDAVKDTGIWHVRITAAEKPMRLACVALNLHAEQSPWDSTPAEQARALEALWAPENVLPDNPHGQMAALEFAVWTLQQESVRESNALSDTSRVYLDSAIDRLNDVIGLAGDWVRDYEIQQP
jgi:hypothetical protein